MLPAIDCENTMTEGKRYRENFAKHGGPEVLE
jgi:hypothetical protein